MPPADDPRTHLRSAARMAAIQPFHVMEIQRRAFELEASGRRIVHMEIGQPDFPAPQPVIEAAVAALRREPMGYTDALGIPPLREAIAKFYADRYRLTIAPERIVVTAGASGAFLVAMGCLVGTGDEVLMPDPCYPSNRHFVRMF
jgi:aspartate/methionine/tyrosine aminotransferase